MTHPSAADIRIGTVLRDTYELTSLLGRGGMGAVFAARHLRLPGKQVAVKVLTHDEDLSPEQFARFRREAEIASQLGHPNIIEVLDFHTLENGTPYLVMEYLRGESLSHRLRKGRLATREAFSIARQMGSALHAAHRAGVVHRDLKPANVFLVPTESEGLLTERVKLLDFGISKLMGSQTLKTQDDVLLGTPRYMAPEQAMGRNSEVDARSDLFALGAMVYEMLCGDSPFAGGTIAEVVYRVVHEHPESLAVRCPDLPARAVAAVDRALAKNPKDRYADVATFISELTGTALQTLSRPGQAAPSAPPRGALPPTGTSNPDDDSGTDNTFVPARGGPPSAVVASGPSGPAPEPSVEKGSTLEAFRQAAAEPSPSVRAASRPTEPELAAVMEPTAVKAPVPQASPAQPAPAPSAALPVSTPVPAPAAPPEARRGSKLGVGIAAAVVLLVGGVVAGRMLTSAPPAPPSGGTPGPVVEAPVASPAPVAPPAAPVEAAPPEVQPDPAPPPVAVTASNKPAATRPVRAVEETLSPEARADLDEATRALEAGQPDEAIRAAQRSQRKQVSSASHAVLARAYCRKGDRSNANAQWRQLAVAHRKPVSDYCKQYDITFN